MAEQTVIRPRYFILYVLIIAAALLACLAFGILNIGGVFPIDAWALGVLYVGIFVLAGIGLAAVFLKYLATYYIITDHEIISVQGLITKTRRSVPFGKIDNITVARGIPDYILHTASIHIDTPGGPGHEVVMKYIETHQLHWLEELIKEKASHYKTPQGPAAQETRDEFERFERPAEEVPAPYAPPRRSLPRKQAAPEREEERPGPQPPPKRRPARSGR